MKEVITIARCDKCGAPDAETYTEINSRGKPVEIDLDKPCRDEMQEIRRQVAEITAKMLAPVMELIDDKGIKPEKVAKQAKAAAAKYEPAVGKRICLLCPETRDTDWGLRDH